MNQGIYELLVTKAVAQKLSELDKSRFYVKESEVDKSEAALILSQHLSTSIKYALSIIKGEHSIEKQIEICNNIIGILVSEFKKEAFEGDLIEVEGRILKAVFQKVDANFSNLDLHLEEITPYTRLSHSELFSGGTAGLSLESELRKEILSSNNINLLVSFIKWKGFVSLQRELQKFTESGGKLKVITTTYMGASDYKAIVALSELENTEVKVSYNTGNERLHAKAYMFNRNSGFHTAYIGSSNFSRTALTDGLEWNLKVTTREVSHIIDKFHKTFESYWENPEFETFSNEKHGARLIEALSNGKSSPTTKHVSTYFDIKPYPFQKEILEQLETERVVHNRFRNLIVAATGTGKTVISAFDYKSFRQLNKTARLLFVTHRKEILVQARSTFQGILKDNNFGELWVDGMAPNNYDHVFASIQSLSNALKSLSLSPKYYDYIIIDEVHHISASSYRPILKHFEPKILLGLTATPERMDGANILEDFSDRIGAEIRLPEALNRKLLCPFLYFGIADSIDLTNVKWEKGRYVASELSSIYTANDLRVGEILNSLRKYCNDIYDVRALGFCVTIEHAKFMAEKFTLAGIPSAYLTSENTHERDLLRQKLMSKVINYLFVVDIFNEGVDIPEIDTILFLRPTESLTVFLQQLGRGLRLAEGKDSLTVLDFIGNSRSEYNFENKFRALIGKTTSSVSNEIKNNFPHLPLGCSIILESKAKETILKNIIAATSINRNQLINKIRNFEHQTDLPFTLTNFLNINNLSIQSIYKKGSWKRLCQLAGKISEFSTDNESQIVSMIENKWLSTSSHSYFTFIRSIAKKYFELDIAQASEKERLMLLMLHYDFWQKAGGFNSLEESIAEIGKNPVLVEEIIEVLNYLIDKIDYRDIEIELPYEQPLKVHSRYTRSQILTAFGLNTFTTSSSNREGVAENKKINTELLFVDLFKSKEDYSPTTMYEDYAITDTLFHWQSQNQTRSDLGKGLTYINHKKLGKIILLFVREKAEDQYGNTMGYVFLGSSEIVDYYGSKPMSIKWRLNEAIPPYLWNDSAKMAQ